MRVAAVDLGTNSTRLLVADSAGGEIHREAVVTGLGRGVDASRRFDPERLADTLDAVSRFSATCRDLGVERIAAVATSAARDVVDGESLLAGVEDRLGVRPDIIGGGEEAELSFAGATSAVDGDGPFLVVDIGGGSTEFTFGELGAAHYSISVDVGSVRITERAVPSRPAPAAEVVAARELAARMLSAVELPERPQTMIGVAGTFTSLAAIDSGLPAYDREVVDGYVLTHDDLISLVRRLSRSTVDETAAIPALDPARAPIILGGAIVAERALAHVGAGSVTVSEHDLLDGLVARMLG